MLRWPTWLSQRFFWPAGWVKILTKAFHWGHPYFSFMYDCHLGTPVRSIIDEFLEKFQTAFDPPPPFFGKNVAIFSKVMTTSTEFATKFFGSEMTPPLFQSFSGNSWPKVQFLMQKKLQRNFLDRKWPPLPPLELFQKFIDNGSDGRPLAMPLLWELFVR